MTESMAHGGEPMRQKRRFFVPPSSAAGFLGDSSAENEEKRAEAMGLYVDSHGREGLSSLGTHLVAPGPKPKGRTGGSPGQKSIPT